VIASLEVHPISAPRQVKYTGIISIINNNLTSLFKVITRIIFLPLRPVPTGQWREGRWGFPG